MTGDYHSIEKNPFIKKIIKTTYNNIKCVKNVFIDIKIYDLNPQN